MPILKKIYIQMHYFIDLNWKKFEYSEGRPELIQKHKSSIKLDFDNLLYFSCYK